jgi:hypothetical protein
MIATRETILRKAEVRRRIPVGKTKFESDIVPRLTKVRLGPRCVGFTESSVEKLIEKLILTTADMPPIPPVRAPRMKRGRPPTPR